MARTFLELIQQAVNEIGLSEPTQVFGNVNSLERQYIALANREAKELASVANKNGGWQALHKEYTFTTQFLNTTGDLTEGSNVIQNVASTAGLVVGEWALSGFTAGTIITDISGSNVTVSNPATITGTTQAITFGKVAYALPSDFEYFVQKTFWDNRYKWALIGPITAQEKQILRYGVIASGPRNKFYIRDNKMWLDPVPTDATLIAYDYYSNQPINANAGGTSERWTSDNDTFILSEDCFIQGLKWRFLRANGLDYQEEYDNYMSDVSKEIGRDGGSRDLRLGSNGYQVHFLDGGNIRDTGFGQ